VPTVDICRLRRVLSLLLIVSLFSSASAQGVSEGSKAYVSNTDGRSVSVIDLVTRTEIEQIDVGSEPRASALTPSGQRLLVVNRFSDNVSVIDTATDTVVATIPLTGSEPYNIAVSPDGTRAYVVCKSSDTVNVLNLATNAEIDSIDLVGDSPEGVAVTPDGAKVYVVNRGSEDVDVIATSSNTIVASGLPAPNSPRDARVSADGTRVIIVGEGGPVILNVANDAQVGVDQPSLGYQRDVDVHGSLAYVTNFWNSSAGGSGTLDVYDLANGMHVTSIVLSGRTPYGVAVSPDGAWAWVSAQDDDAVIVVDLVAQAEVGNMVSVGNNPRGISAMVIVPVSVPEGVGLFPKKVLVRLRGTGRDRLVVKGFFDDGGEQVDLTQDVTITIGDYQRTMRLSPRSSRRTFVYKDSGTYFKIRLNQHRSSRGKFTLMIDRGSLSGLIDPAGETPMALEVEGGMSVTAVVRLEDGRYRYGKRRGALLAPMVFIVNGKIRLRGKDHNRDNTRLKIGLGGPAPAILGTVTISLGPNYFLRIDGSSFRRKGDVFRYEHHSGSDLWITLDYERARARVRHHHKAIGPLENQRIEIEIDPGTGVGASSGRTLGKKGAL
jgi:YVTN family beta-propeller protein